MCQKIEGVRSWENSFSQYIGKRKADRRKVDFCSEHNWDYVVGEEQALDPDQLEALTQRYDFDLDVRAARRVAVRATAPLTGAEGPRTMERELALITIQLPEAGAWSQRACTPLRTCFSPCPTWPRRPRARNGRPGGKPPPEDDKSPATTVGAHKTVIEIY